MPPRAKIAAVNQPHAAARPERPGSDSSGLPAKVNYARALALRAMAEQYAELPRYLLAPEVVALLHFLPNWIQHEVRALILPGTQAGAE